LEIQGKRWRRLRWIRYDVVCVYGDGRSVSSAIDVKDSGHFPSLAFSNVRSYVGKSEAALA